MRKNKSQRDQRRSHIHANLPRLSTDPETGSIHLRHRVDLKTGMYRGRKVLSGNAPVILDEDDVVKTDKTADKEVKGKKDSPKKESKAKTTTKEKAVATK